MPDNSGKSLKSVGSTPATAAVRAGDRTVRSHVAPRIEVMAEAYSEAVIETLYDKALNGDLRATRLFLDRFGPHRRAPLSFDLPEMRTSADALDAMRAVIRAMAAGEVPVRDAEKLMDLIEHQQQILQSAEREARAAALETLAAAAAVADPNARLH